MKLFTFYCSGNWVLLQKRRPPTPEADALQTHDSPFWLVHPHVSHCCPAILLLVSSQISSQHSIIFPLFQSFNNLLPNSPLLPSPAETFLPSWKFFLENRFQNFWPNSVLWGYTSNLKEKWLILDIGTAWFIFHPCAKQRKPCQWEMDDRGKGWALAGMQTHFQTAWGLSVHCSITMGLHSDMAACSPLRDIYSQAGPFTPQPHMTLNT